MALSHKTGGFVQVEFAVDILRVITLNPWARLARSELSRTVLHV
jgi:hypothetical protein